MLIKFLIGMVVAVSLGYFVAMGAIAMATDLKEIQETRLSKLDNV